MKDTVINSCKCKSNNPQIAKEDIICYKIILKGDSIGSTPKGIYVDTHYSNFIYPDTLEYAKGKYEKNNWFKVHILRQPKYCYKEESVKWNKENQWWDITYGFLHSVPYKIKDIHNYLPWFTKGTAQLWQCKIPKGTLYYQADCRGSHFECANSYASKKLLFVGLIEEVKINPNKCGGGGY